MGRDAQHADAHRGRVHRRRGSAAQSRRRHRHRAHPRLHRVASAQHSPLPPAPRLHADATPPGVGRRRPLQPRIPRAPHGPAAAGHGGAAEAADRADLLAGARPRAPALGAVGGRGARGRQALRVDLQGPPLHDRRRLGRRADDGPDEPLADGGARARWSPYVPRPAPSALELRRDDLSISRPGRCKRPAT